jgi:hypothetical protein
MEEARRVISRLERIEALKGTGGEPGALLAELRELLREGEEWVAAEGPGTAAARTALGALEGALGVARAERVDSLSGEEVAAGNAAL